MGLGGEPVQESDLGERETHVKIPQKSHRGLLPLSKPEHSKFFPPPIPTGRNVAAKR